MTSDVKITIISVFANEYGEEDKTSFHTIGKYYEKEEGLCLQYVEEDSQSKTVTHNTLTLGKQTMELVRDGSITSSMLFTVGETLSAEYTTPYGAMQLNIHTNELNAYSSDDRIIIKLSYDLLQENTLLSHNRMTIKIRAYTAAGTE